MWKVLCIVGNDFFFFLFVRNSHFLQKKKKLFLFLFSESIEKTRDLQFPRMYEFINILISSQHCLILLDCLIVSGSIAIIVSIPALVAVLSILGCFHVAEKSQDIWIVGTRFSQFIEFAWQLRRDEIRIGRITSWATIHRANRIFPATLAVVAKTWKHGVKTRQQRRVEWIVIRQQKWACRYFVEDLKKNFVLQIIIIIYIYGKNKKKKLIVTVWQVQCKKKYLIKKIYYSIKMFDFDRQEW